MARTFTILAAAFGLLAVLAGTFGAHGLRQRLSADDLAIWETAARYQMYHALALLGVAWACERFRSRAIVAAGWLFAAGILIFGGSLYKLAASELIFGQRQPWLGMIAPIGGLCLIAGWICLLVGAIRWDRKPQPG